MGLVCCTLLLIYFPLWQFGVWGLQKWLLCVLWCGWLAAVFHIDVISPPSIYHFTYFCFETVLLCMIALYFISLI